MHTYRMYLAVSTDTPTSRGVDWGAFAFIILSASGERLHLLTPDADAAVNLTSGEDCHFAAIMMATHVLPEGSHIEVISRQEHYHGNAAYVGPLNERAEQRIARGYRKPNSKQFIHCHEHLERMDGALAATEMTVSGRRPRGTEEEELLAEAFEQAQLAKKYIDEAHEALAWKEGR